MEVHRRDILFLALGLLSSISATVFTLLTVPDFIAIYRPVAAQLPVQTRLLFSLYGASILIPALVVCVWCFWRNPRARGPVSAAFGVLTGAVFVAFVLWALYQPELMLQLIKRGPQ